MTTYYAVCDANGPISVRLDGATASEAVEFFEAADQVSWIDGCSTDAEGDLGINGDGMSEGDFCEALRGAGCARARDLEVVLNTHAGTAAHLRGGWVLWAKG